MGENEKQEELVKDMSEKQEEIINQLRMNLKEFPTKENWDRFFTVTGCDDCSELCAEWPQLQYLLTSHLLLPSSSPSSPSSSQQPESAGVPVAAVHSEEVAILVPGCGNSRLSEHLYDAGFTNITNVDLSKVIITHMMRRNVRERPRMKWRVMDMTSMQFAKETFDAIVDKGGLDVLMEPTLGLKLGNLYASEVKRLLKAGGKYICVTLAESKVLGLLFPRFRYGWKVNLYIIAPGPSSGDLNQQSFMVVAEKLVSTSISQISSFLDEYSVESRGSQAHELYEALERENRIRRVYSDAFDKYKPLEDVKTNLKELKPGRRLKLALGEPGVSRFCYNSILLDAQQDFGPFFVQFLVFILPNTRNLEWIVLFSKKQWVYVENFKTARLLMVVLDSRHSNVNMEDIQKDLSPFVKQLAPGDCDGDKVPFVTTIDGMRREEIVHQITSAVSGLIVVDDVIYEKAHNPYIPGKDLIVRRLTTESLVQSKALLTREGPIGISSEVEKKRVQATSETSKKGKHKTFHSQSSGSHASSGVLKVLHNHLIRPRHNAIISGIMLISLYLKATSVEGLVKTMFIGLIPLFQIQTVVIGLGAGVLPMFMNKWLPYLKIEVLELDDMVLNVAREYFDFKEGERLQVHITNGIEFIMEKANSDVVQADGIGSSKIDILIVDVASPESSCPLTSPAPAFVMESFLWTAKNSLSEEGLYVVNLVTRSSKVKGEIYSKLKKVFGNLFSIQLEEDVNEVIFALNTNSPINEDHLSEACDALVRLLEFEKQEWGQRVIEASRLIKPLKFVDENL